MSDNKTTLRLKIAETEVTVELDGCDAEFDGATLKIKAKAQPPIPSYPWWPAQFYKPSPSYPYTFPYTTTTGQNSYPTLF